MKKKIFKFFIAVFILLCAGCDINYNLTINEDLFYQEEITSKMPGTYTEEEKKYIVLQNKKLYGKIYDITAKQTEENFQLKFTDNRNILKTEYSNMYFNQSVESNDESITITAIPTEKFQFLFQSVDVIEAEVNKVTVNITTLRKVTDQNADSVKDNVYTWVYTDELSEKPIKITIQNIKQTDTKIIKKKKNNDMYFIIIGTILALGSIIITIKQYIKSKKNNQL